MRIQGKQTLGLLLAAAMMFSFSGCEKKADIVEGNTVSEETVSESGDNSQSDTEEANSEAADSERWTENLTGDGSGFESVDVSATLYDYSKKELSTCTVQIEEFNSDFVKEMCESVFDPETVEVYDFNHKTKAVYDELIGHYENAAKLYDVAKDHEERFFKYYVYDFISSGYGELRESTEPMERSEIEADIERLKTERESAPETIENDYSYQGYKGMIGGEEYSLYFGNRNFVEYMSSPCSVQWNGRVVTLMKSDIQSQYAGTMEDMYFSENDVVSAANEPDNPMYIKNAIITDRSTANISYAEISNPVGEETIQKAKDIITDLGYGDYVYNPDETTGLMWSNAVNDYFMYSNGYRMTVPSMLTTDGWMLRFELDTEGPDRLEDYDITTADYVEDGDSLDYRSYIDVMINGNGVLGCQINNPVKVLKNEPVTSNIDRDSLKDIVRDSINNKELWNIPEGKKVALFNIENVKLIQFPIRSSEGSDEYTFIPCYVVYKQQLDEANALSQKANSAMGILIPPMSAASNPFLLINAIDGSIVDAGAQLEDYPKGWDNGNTGYENFIQDGWTRYEKKYDNSEE